MELALKDVSHLVRGRAVEHLGPREELPAFEAARSVLQGDSSEFVRRAAVTGLAARIANPAVRAELERAANEDPSETVREAALKFLQG